MAEDSPTPPTDSTAVPPAPAAPPATVARNPDSIDMGCMVGLAMILLFLPVSLYVGAPLTVLGVAAAGLAWGLMRLTSQRLRNTIGYGKVWLIWFLLLILIEVGVAVWIYYNEKFGGEFTPRG